MKIKIEFNNKRQFDLLRILGIVFLIILGTGAVFSAVITNKLTATGDSSVDGNFNVTGTVYTNTIKNREGSDLYIGDSPQSIRFNGNGNIITSQTGNSVLVSASDIYLQTNSGTNAIKCSGSDTYIYGTLTFGNNIYLKWKNTTGTEIGIMKLNSANNLLLLAPEGKSVQIPSNNFDMQGNNVTNAGYITTVSSLAGSGNAYVCVDASGNLFRSAIACV